MGASVLPPRVNYRPHYRIVTLLSLPNDAVSTLAGGEGRF